MAIRILSGDDGKVLYDSVTNTAFGPVFKANDDAEDFIEWYARRYIPKMFEISKEALDSKVWEWIREKREVTKDILAHEPGPFIEDKSREEIEKLKRQWRHDPCWDIEHTEGFEAHKDELRAYREMEEQNWRLKKRRGTADEMKRMGITSGSLYRYLKDMENRIEQLQKQVDKLSE